MKTSNKWCEELSAEQGLDAESIKQIQLDAMKEGMALAVKICIDSSKHKCYTWGDCAKAIIDESMKLNVNNI